MAKRGTASGEFRRTRWSGVYERNGLYYPRLYVGKVDGRSKFEWLDPQPRGELAADELARVRAGRSRRASAGGRTPSRRGARSSDDHPLGLWLSLRPRAKESTNRGYADQVKPFVAEYGDMLLRDVDVELALEWLEVRRMRWTLGRPARDVQRRSPGRAHRAQPVPGARSVDGAWAQEHRGPEGRPRCSSSPTSRPRLGGRAATG